MISKPEQMNKLRALWLAYYKGMAGQLHNWLHTCLITIYNNVLMHTCTRLSLSLSLSYSPLLSLTHSYTLSLFSVTLSYTLSISLTLSYTLSLSLTLPYTDTIRNWVKQRSEGREQQGNISGWCRWRARYVIITCTYPYCIGYYCVCGVRCVVLVSYNIFFVLLGNYSATYPMLSYLMAGHAMPFNTPTHRISSYPTPSHLIQSHTTSSHPILTYFIYFNEITPYAIQYLVIPFHPILSHPITPLLNPFHHPSSYHSRQQRRAHWRSPVPPCPDSQGKWKASRKPGRHDGCTGSSSAVQAQSCR